MSADTLWRPSDAARIPQMTDAEWRAWRREVIAYQEAKRRQPDAEWEVQRRAILAIHVCGGLR